METKDIRRSAGRAPARGLRAPAGPFTLRLASEVGELEAALALEARSGRRAIGIDGPSAAPLCDFLMLFDRADRAAGVCRLLPHAPRDFSGFAEKVRHIHAPLFTALRYAGLGVLEVGSLVAAPGADASAVCGALWQGIQRYMDKHAMAFALGWETLAVPASASARECAARLSEDYGLFSDPAVKFRRTAAPGESTAQVRAAAGLSAADAAWLPAGLTEVLRRGARLAGDPVRLPEGAAGMPGGLDFLWVATRD
jgi:hypothetical protein